MNHILTILSLLILSFDSAYSVETYLRRGFDNSTVWNTIHDCISRHFNGKTIVDRVSSTHDRFALWIDSGNNIDYVVTGNVTDAILRCIYDKHPNVTIDVHLHNQFAVAGSRYSDTDVSDFYDYFGHGYPIDYDPDYSSEEYGDVDSDVEHAQNDGNSNTDYSTLAVSNQGSKPDSMGKPRQNREHLTISWYGKGGDQDFLGSNVDAKTTLQCGMCYSIPNRIASSLLVSNQQGYEIDLMFGPHHACRYRSSNGSRFTAGKTAKAGTNEPTDVDYRVGSFWTQCNSQDGWPNADTGSKVSREVIWLNKR
ncbi:hypothetical protein SPOG_03605 [Schizosaccharomyces cryophilus OY26]|uniref:Uncharacterized protein n=1 Tax=Schizosaccharomyces cryophilus (strain OY26 / ATCC MYA-4695 / CBS 11777 / NBRC 106824 / NRRL Y48691) TaxID=653667 RepID=S9XHA1_SCHCR|nr:uncharacterized protein SPOG_03605 [Schizosaccharomyces cryophilus OY26]EPY53051.1 hypothetical protein SPOG_03605 [Schizosaccharomyces cryophilus OY26]